MAHATWRSISEDERVEMLTVANSKESSKRLVSGFLLLLSSSRLQSFVLLLILDDSSSSELEILFEWLRAIFLFLRILILTSPILYHIYYIRLILWLMLNFIDFSHHLQLHNKRKIKINVTIKIVCEVKFHVYKWE